MTTTIHVAIGNSDDHLSQAEWSSYWMTVEAAIAGSCDHIYGKWLSAANAPHQNACWAFTCTEPQRGALRALLGVIAAQYAQNSIAWNESMAEMIVPERYVNRLVAHRD